MKDYYISDGQDTIGPLSKLKLFSQNITKETLVWYEGLSEWKKAGDIEELADLFSSKQVPPPLPSQAMQIPNLSESAHERNTVMPVAESEQKKKSTKKIVFLCVGIFISMLILTAIGYYYYEQYEQQEIQYRTESNETSHPEWYLSIENESVKDNTLTGSIVNSSNYTSYKQIQIQLSYYDKNGKILQSNVHTIVGTYYPQTSTPFKVKIRLPQGAKNFFKTQSYGLEITGAEVKYD